MYEVSLLPVQGNSLGVISPLLFYAELSRLSRWKAVFLKKQCELSSRPVHFTSTAKGSLQQKVYLVILQHEFRAIKNNDHLKLPRSKWWFNFFCIILQKHFLCALIQIWMTLYSKNTAIVFLPISQSLLLAQNSIYKMHKF